MDEQGGAGLSPRMIALVADARTQWAGLDRRIAAFDAEFVRWANENEDTRRLTTIRHRHDRGNGARRRDWTGGVFDRGRDLSAWLGVFHVSSPPEANRSCSESASAAIHISASS
ncbi:transposase [Bradyrhizobium sp. GM5.1]|nr:hypothetical protein [Bradyrhizobium sp. 156]